MQFEIHTVSVVQDLREFDILLHLNLIRLLSLLDGSIFDNCLLYFLHGVVNDIILSLNSVDRIEGTA